MIKVVVSGACGRMGREVVKAILGASTLELVGAVDTYGDAVDAGTLVGMEKTGVIVSKDLAETLKTSGAQVMVDFTRPEAVMGNLRIAISAGVAPVVGTTGLTDTDREELRTLCGKHHTNCLIAPNFAIGAILMMKFAQDAAKYMPHVEIIELHHDQKLDAPSGTALRTAELITETRQAMKQGHPQEEEKLVGARGAEMEGMHIHSVRLPGYVAHQEVIFGALGQTLVIRHDSISRESFMPGVVLACERILSIDGLIIGLENILD